MPEASSTYRVTNQQRMASRKALEWIRTSKVFRYDISDLLPLIRFFLQVI